MQKVRNAFISSPRPAALHTDRIARQPRGPAALTDEEIGCARCFEERQGSYQRPEMLNESTFPIADIARGWRVPPRAEDCGTVNTAVALTHEKSQQMLFDIPLRGRGPLTFGPALLPAPRAEGGIRGAASVRGAVAAASCDGAEPPDAARPAPARRPWQ